DQAGKDKVQHSADKHQRLVCGCRTKGKQREAVEFVQLDSRYGMRKEVQNNSGCNPKLLAQKERIGELVQALAVGDEDQFVYTAAFEERANFIPAVNADKLQAPHAVLLNRAREVISVCSMTDDGHVAYVQCAVPRDFHQNDTIGHQKDVIERQCEQDNEAVRSIRLHEGDCSGHDQTSKTYCLAQPDNLRQRRQSRVGINAEQGQQDGPGRKDDCQEPQVYSNGHYGVPFQFEQRPETVRQKKACRREKQI